MLSTEEIKEIETPVAIPTLAGLKFTLHHSANKPGQPALDAITQDLVNAGMDPNDIGYRQGAGFGPYSDKIYIGFPTVDAVQFQTNKKGVPVIW